MDIVKWILSPRLRKIYHLRDGDVVTIGTTLGTYITACEDRKRVSLEEKMEGSNNGQHWTVVVVRSPLDGSLSHRFRLKSMYGTFLHFETTSWLWHGCPDELNVCQAPWCIAGADGFPVYPKWWELTGETNAPSGWFGLASKIRADSMQMTVIFPRRDNRIDFLVSFMEEEINETYWHIQIVRDNKPPVAAPSLDNNSKSCSTKLNKYKVEFNFSNKMGSSSGPSSTAGGVAPPSLYNTGRNTNGSGTQNNGDLDVRNRAGKYENFNFQFH